MDNKIVLFFITKIYVFSDEMVEFSYKTLLFFIMIFLQYKMLLSSDNSSLMLNFCDKIEDSYIMTISDKFFPTQLMMKNFRHKTLTLMKYYLFMMNSSVIKTNIFVVIPIHIAQKY